MLLPYDRNDSRGWSISSNQSSFRFLHVHLFIICVSVLRYMRRSLSRPVISMTTWQAVEFVRCLSVQCVTCYGQGTMPTVFLVIVCKDLARIAVDIVNGHAMHRSCWWIVVMISVLFIHTQQSFVALLAAMAMDEINDSFIQSFIWCWFFFYIKLQCCATMIQWSHFCTYQIIFYKWHVSTLMVNACVTNCLDKSLSFWAISHATFWQMLASHRKEVGIAFFESTCC